MFPDNVWFKTAMRFGLLFYSIFIGASGLITGATLFLVVPQEDLPGTLIPYGVMLIPLYISCVIALVIRAKFFKKDDITVSKSTSSSSDARTRDEEFVLQVRSFVKKALRAALLIYAILFSVSGTILFGFFVFGLIPKEDLSKAALPLSIAALFLYGSCILAIWIRTKVPRQ